MPAMYEFHVTGLIGPVVQSALPELTSQPASKHSVLMGTVGEPVEVENLLEKLTDHGLVTDHIVIAPRTRWRDTNPSDSTDVGPVSGTDDGVDEARNYSAPRQS